MLRKSLHASAGIVVVLALLATTGCSSIPGSPTLGVFSYPIPVSPYFQDSFEREHYVHRRYERTPILGPITAGAPALALDPPSEDEVMQALEDAHPVRGGVPLLYETQRKNVRITVDPISDYVDPPRVFPLIGPAQQHHAHYKCTVYYTEVVRVGWPVPFTTTDEDVQEVIYIDHNHLHMVGNVDPGPGSNY